MFKYVAEAKNIANSKCEIWEGDKDYEIRFLDYLVPIYQKNPCIAIYLYRVVDCVMSEVLESILHM